MGQRDTDTAAARLHELLHYRQRPVTGPEGHSFTAFRARTPATSAPIPYDTDVVEQIDAAVAEVVAHTRTVNPEAGPLPDRVAAVYDWAREHVEHAPETDRFRQAVIEARHRMEHAVATGDVQVIRAHRCPDCSGFGLHWPSDAGRNPKAKAVCANRHCANRNKGVHRRWSLAQLAYEQVAAEKMLRECAT